MLPSNIFFFLALRFCNCLSLTKALQGTDCSSMILSPSQWVILVLFFVMNTAFFGDGASLSMGSTGGQGLYPGGTGDGRQGYYPGRQEGGYFRGGKGETFSEKVNKAIFL